MHFSADRTCASIVAVVICGAAAAVLSAVQTSARQTGASSRAPALPAPRAVFDTYCVTCHNQRLKTAGLTLDTLDVTNPAANAEVWEKVIAKLRQASMPPPGMP